MRLPYDVNELTARQGRQIHGLIGWTTGLSGPGGPGVSD